MNYILFPNLSKSILKSTLPLCHCMLIAPLTCSAFAIGSAPAAYAATQSGTALTFVDADARLVAETILGDMLRLPYFIDPDVQGNVTLNSTSPVPDSQLLPMLERALLPINAVIVVRDGKYQVLPRDKARTMIADTQITQPPPPLNIQSNAQSPDTDIVTLNHISAAEMVGLARDLIGGDIVTRDGSNPVNIRIKGSLSEREAALDLVRRFDIPSLADMRFEIWKLADANPSAVLDELNTIFAPPNNIFDGRVRLIPLPRIKSIMAIAADRSDLDRIEPWIRRVEQGTGGKRSIRTHSVQNGKARDIALSLQLVLGLNNDQEQYDESQQISEGSDGSSGPLPPARNYGTKDGLRIVPNDSSNMLLIYANAEEYAIVSKALEAIDRPSAQVLIEATLAEVTLNDELRYGINFQALGNIGSSAINIANSSNNSATPAANFPGFAVSAISSSVSSVLSALQSKTKVRVLSAPKLQVLNNRPASLQVGDQVPIVTQQAQSVDGANAPLINSVELRDTGVILQVTPRINDNGTVLLEISQEVSDVAQTTSSGINSPTIQQRRLTTTVVTQSGQMVVLGGLIRNRVTTGKSGIPGLSQIPIIGGLFGRKADSGSRTELVILITPSIIRGPDDVRNTVNSVIDNLDLTKPMVEEADKRAVARRIR
jgi:general secretion pathway protein D